MTSLRCGVALLALAGCLAMPASVRAQHTLVLSGGGARGLAHAGALVALEERGYDPPLIVGTSMGAIIGALYAAGHEPRDIRDIIGAENWLERFSAEPLLFGVKRSARRPLVSLGVSRGRFHEGLVSTTGVNQRLVELLFDAGVRAGGSFDALPRRYRAVTADLATGEQVVLSEGDLPRAVRASMAVPGAFAPVAWQDRVLVDGGIINNLAVSVARELSRAPVVAVDVVRLSDSVVERSAAALGVRAIRLLIANAMRGEPPPEVLVVPELRPSFAESRFPADAHPLMESGYRAALEQAPRASDPPVVRNVVDERPARIDTLVINATGATERLVRRMMGSSIPGAYDAAAILRGTAALYSTGLFQDVWPRVEERGGRVALVLDVTPVPSTIVAAAAGWDYDVGAAGWAMLRQRVVLLTPMELRASFEGDGLARNGALELAAFSTLFPGMTLNAGAHTGEAWVRAMRGDDVVGDFVLRRAGAWAGIELRAPDRKYFVSALLRGDRTRWDGQELRSWGPMLRLAGNPQPDRVVGMDPLLLLEHRPFGDAFSLLHVRLSRTVRPGRLRAAALGDLSLVSDGTPLDRWPSSVRGLVPWLPHGALRGDALLAGGIDVAWPTVLDGYVRGRVRAYAGDVASGGLRRTGVGGDFGLVWASVLGTIEVGVAAGTGARGPRLNASITAH